MPLYRDPSATGSWVTRMWAYSVRPDLWPPGSLVLVLGTGYSVVPASRSIPLASARASLDGAIQAGLAGPGAAEALVLSGRAYLYPEDYQVTHPWVEVT